jgi:hypothetical protein
VLLDALNRHRGKGQQKVTVEHVHVAPGGQAVVAGGKGSAEIGGSSPGKGDNCGFSAALSCARLPVHRDASAI